MDHLLDLRLCRSFILVARIFTCKDVYRLKEERLVERSGDKGLKAVVDLQQFLGEQLPALCDDIIRYVGVRRNPIQRTSVSHRGGHVADGVRVAAHGDGQAQAVQGAVSLQEGHDGNGHTALASGVKTVPVTNILQLDIEMIAKLLFYIPFDLSFRVKASMNLQIDTGGYGLRSLDALWVVVSDRGRDLCQLQRLLKRVGIHPHRAHPQGRPIAKAAVGLGNVRAQPLAERASISSIGIPAPHVLHDPDQAVRTMRRIIHQPFGHGQCHHRGVSKPAALRQQLEILRLHIVALPCRAYDITNDCS